MSATRANVLTHGHCFDGLVSAVVKPLATTTYRLATTNAATGPVTVEYLETYDDGTHLIASTQANLR